MRQREQETAGEMVSEKMIDMRHKKGAERRDVRMVVMESAVRRVP